MLCQSEWACLHKTVNMVVFFVKSNENTYQKGRALMQMYVQSCPYNKKRECTHVVFIVMIQVVFAHYKMGLTFLPKCSLWTAIRSPPLVQYLWISSFLLPSAASLKATHTHTTMQHGEKFCLYLGKQHLFSTY